MQYRIFPPIGVARVGGDDDFFIGPEVPGRGATEASSGSTVTRFKSADMKNIRKQAARFHLFQSSDGQTWTPMDLPPEAVVSWNVTLHNKKAAVMRPAETPAEPQLPQVDPTSNGMYIQAPTETISGVSQQSAALRGTFRTTDSDGTPFRETVTLGRLRTDEKGRLIVIGGNGTANAPAGVPIGFDHTENQKWYDDVSDGPVTAWIDLNDGSSPIRVGGAWVIVAPPDFTGGVGGIVTLYDVLRQIGIEAGDLLEPPATPWFDRDILPMIERAKRHRQAYSGGARNHSAFDHPKIRSKDPADKVLRAAIMADILAVEADFKGQSSSTAAPRKLCDYQIAVLEAYVEGNFDDASVGWPIEPTAAGLTQAALEGAVEQGFCPGTEAGVLLADPSIYERPFDFRIDHEIMRPGDLTALMAQPWQVDFLKSQTDWWTSRDKVSVSKNSAPEDAPEGSMPGIEDRRHLVSTYERLGFVLASGNGA